MAIGSPSAFFSWRRERVIGRPLAGGACDAPALIGRAPRPRYAPLFLSLPPSQDLVVDEPGSADPRGHGEQCRAVDPLHRREVLRRAELEVLGLHARGVELRPR